MRSNLQLRLSILLFAITAIAAGPNFVENSSRLSAAEKRPNIVLIVADDLGWGELSVQGSKDIPTPHIDSIANGGIRFTNGYVSCPVCSPTRAGLMTGRYQQRFGHEFNPGPGAVASPEFGLPLDEVTLPQRLKKLGYTTGMVGKWHLGFRPEFQPTQRGFDEFFGFLGGSHRYFENQRGPHEPMIRGTDEIPEEGYMTENFAREAVAFLEKHKAEPFFLYLPFNAVHNPIIAPYKYLSRFPKLEDERRRRFAGTLSAMDDAVGTVLEKLEAEKLTEKTLVVFISDNGGPTRQTTSSNLPLRGRKSFVYEGGIRVPYFMQWKGTLPAKTLYDQPVISLDLLPTLVAAAGGSIDPHWKLDGVNLLPYLKGEVHEAPHKELYWRFGPEWAIRQGDWKLVASEKATVPMLVNLKDDISETKDLSGAEPAKVQALTAAYKRWASELVEPRWEREH